MQGDGDLFGICHWYLPKIGTVRTGHPIEKHENEVTFLKFEPELSGFSHTEAQYDAGTKIAASITEIAET